MHVHPDGYAFVLAERPGDADLYVGGTGIRPAMHGDRVRVAVLRRRRGKLERTEGRVVEVLERHLPQILGIFRQGRTGAYLMPQDPRVLYRVTLTGGAPAHDGDVVVAAITRFPGPYEDIEARAESVLGPASDPRVEIEAIVWQHDLPRAFPEAVQRAARRMPAEVDVAAALAAPVTVGHAAPPAATAPLAGMRDAAAGPAGASAARPREAAATELPAPAQARRPWHESPVLAHRLDLRALSLVTIDGENARDFDDAVGILDGPDGGTRLVVAIADVAAYVPRASALDREARARGTSVYFPDRVIPMLPEELSNGICSLSPAVDRLAQVVLVDCDRRGEALGAAFFPALIRSRARLTYTEVRAIVTDRDLPTRRRHATLVDDLERMVALGEQLARLRHRRGSIDLDLPEAEIVLDLRGQAERIVQAERNDAHRMIESFMIAANEAVAGYLTARGIPLPYRVHEPPAEDALRDLARFLAGFGIVLAAGGDEVRPVAVQRALERVGGRPEERLVHTIVLRSMRQARYAPRNLGHFGLASRCYTHFTSPIRRYPDLVLHRILAAHQAGDGAALAAATADLGAVCDESSERERVAMDAEREVVQLHKVQFMKDRLGETFAGHVSGVVGFGFFVELDEYFVEGLVHVATLTDDRYELVEHQHLLRGRRRRRVYRLGDPVRVRVASVSIERRQIDLVLA